MGGALGLMGFNAAGGGRVRRQRRDTPTVGRIAVGKRDAEEERRSRLKVNQYLFHCISPVFLLLNCTDFAGSAPETYFEAFTCLSAVE